MASKFMYTPVKRSHLIQGNGVGALIRLRTGVTALVMDLGAWYDAIPVAGIAGFNRDAERERMIAKFRVRDPELEAATGAPFFVTPPPGPSDNVGKGDWLVPAVRFPLAAACTSPVCGRLFFASQDDAKEVRGKQRGCKCGGLSAKYPKPFQQVPIMLVCSDGHIDEIQWSFVAHKGLPPCTNPDVRVRFGASVKRPRVSCETCGSISDPADDLSIECTGRRPWTSEANELCTHKMHVVERTNVSVYYPSVKSSIYIPDATAEDERLLLWLNTIDLSLVDPSSDASLTLVLNKAFDYGFESHLTLGILRRHVEKLIQSHHSDDSDSWDPLQARVRELDTLLSDPSTVGKSSRLLRIRRPDNLTQSPFYGNAGVFSDIVAVERLTETRVLDGFSRWQPTEKSDRARTRRLMWGSRQLPAHKAWLPGYRVTGEGILFVLSSGALNTWQLRLGLPVYRSATTEVQALSPAGRAAHTLAHGIMRVLSDRCGYPLAGIRDRIYDLPDGRVGFLVYTADGDAFGTLGGVVEHADDPLLTSLIDDALMALRWCTQDPVCNSSRSEGELRTPGSCHHCVLVPETSCERFNRDLDRGDIHGSTDRGLSGLVS